MRYLAIPPRAPTLTYDFLINLLHLHIEILTKSFRIKLCTVFISESSLRRSILKRFKRLNNRQHCGHKLTLAFAVPSLYACLHCLLGNGNDQR